MGLDLSSIKASKKAIKAGKGSGKFFKCEPGKNILRLFSYESAAQGKTCLERSIRKHYKLDGATPLCQKTPAPGGKAAAECEYCDRVEEIRKDDGEEVAKRLAANKKFTVNCVPLIVGDNPVEGPLKMVQFDMPTTVMEAVLAVLEDSGESGGPDQYLGINGYDLAITYDPSCKDPKRMYSTLFRNEAASKASTARLKAAASVLTKQVMDLDADPALLPDWYVNSAPKGGGKKAEAPAAEPDDAGGEAFQDPDAPGGGAADGEDADGQQPPAEPDEDNTAADDADLADPEWEGEPLPDGVEAFWSAKKEKFYFTTPSGKSTFDEAEARASVGPKKPKPGAAKPAAAPAAKPKAAAPAAKKGGKK